MSTGIYSKMRPYMRQAKIQYHVFSLWFAIQLPESDCFRPDSIELRILIDTISIRITSQIRPAPWQNSRIPFDADPNLKKLRMVRPIQ